LSKTTWILLGIAAFLVFVALITYQMLGHRQNRVEVCMTFDGRSNCSTAAGNSKEEALRTATDAACAIIAFGVTDSQACGRSKPVSVRWLD
jgi:hypothetical protein